MVKSVVPSFVMPTSQRRSVFKPEIRRISHPEELEQSPSCVRRHFVCFGNEDPKRPDRVYTTTAANA